MSFGEPLLSRSSQIASPKDYLADDCMLSCSPAQPYMLWQNDYPVASSCKPCSQVKTISLLADTSACSCSCTIADEDVDGHATIIQTFLGNTLPSDYNLPADFHSTADEDDDATASVDHSAPVAAAANSANAAHATTLAGYQAISALGTFNLPGKDACLMACRTADIDAGGYATIITDFMANLHDEVPKRPVFGTPLPADDAQEANPADADSAATCASNVAVTTTHQHPSLIVGGKFQTPVVHLAHQANHALGEPLRPQMRSHTASTIKASLEAQTHTSSGVACPTSSDGDAAGALLFGDVASAVHFAQTCPAITTAEPTEPRCAPNQPAFKPKDAVAVAQALPFSALLVDTLPASIANLSSSHDAADADGDAFIITSYLQNLDAEDPAARAADLAAFFTPGDDNLAIHNHPALMIQTNFAGSVAAGVDSLYVDASTADKGADTASSYTSFAAANQPAKATLVGDAYSATIVGINVTMPAYTPPCSSHPVENLYEGAQSRPSPYQAMDDVDADDAVTIIKDFLEIFIVAEPSATSVTEVHHEAVSYFFSCQHEAAGSHGSLLSNECVFAVQYAHACPAASIIQHAMSRHAPTQPIFGQTLLVSDAQAVKGGATKSPYNGRGAPALAPHVGAALLDDSVGHALAVAKSTKHAVKSVAIATATATSSIDISPPTSADHKQLKLLPATPLLSTRILITFDPGGQPNVPSRLHNRPCHPYTLSSKTTHTYQLGFVFSIRLRGRMCGVQAPEITYAADVTKTFKVRSKQRAELLIFYMAKSSHTGRG